MEVTHHLVILEPRFLQLILDGQKRIECRLSKTRRAPFGAVRRGDTLWLKRASGPVLGRARAATSESIELDAGTTIRSIERRYARSLHVDASFFDARPDARYVTIIRLDRVRPVPAIRIAKNSRHPWVVLRGPLERSAKGPTSIA